MRTLLALLIGWLIVVPLMPLAAEPAESEPPKEPEQSQAEPATSTEKRPQPTTTDRSTDTFVPSEEISEDLSVSYPVDI
jgi:hypothetical protein